MDAASREIPLDGTFQFQRIDLLRNLRDLLADAQHTTQLMAISHIAGIAN